ncbi:MAG: hypothetical protein GY854_30625 [Deltaproteobacteria bacterium]|nr:hypothetical protein [Deltaproteobacteria bacterium]
MRRASCMIWAIIIGAAALGCGGTKQPATQVAPPELVLPDARTCPGALPGENIQVTTAIGESNSPVISWTKDAFAIAWWDLRGRFPEVRTVRVDREGVNRSPAKRIPNKGSARDQSLAWDGQEVHLVFSDDGRVMSARLGLENEQPVVLAESGKMPAAGAWGAAIWENGGRLYFRCDSMKQDDANEEAPDPVVIATGGIENPQMAFNGEFFAVVWSASAKGGREIRMQRVSPDGRKLGGPVRVSATAGTSRKPVIAWAGSTFAVSWTNAAPADQNPRDRFRVFFAIVPDVGDAPTMTRQLKFQGSADQVALAATGKEFGLAWVGSKKPVGSAVFLQRIGLDGKVLGDTTEVTDGVPLTCGRPSLAWDGSGYGVTWHDDRAKTGAEVFFSYVECGEELPEPAAPAPEPTAAPADAGPGEKASPAGEPPALKEAFSEKKAEPEKKDKAKKKAPKKDKPEKNSEKKDKAKKAKPAEKK